MRETRCVRGIVLTGALLLLAGAPGRAEQFWIAYEGDDYPENQGWNRVFGNGAGPDQGGANRSVSDGIFTLESLYDVSVCDFYKQERTVDPGPADLFVAEWRVRIDPSSDPHDAGVTCPRFMYQSP